MKLASSLRSFLAFFDDRSISYSRPAGAALGLLTTVLLVLVGYEQRLVPMSGRGRRRVR